MAKHTHLYQRVHYYDIALQRPVATEVDFVQAVFQKHTGRELTSLLEIACGPAYHSVLAAQRGIRAVGLDLMWEMIEFARQRAAAANVQLETVVADMRDFDIAAPVDMAICTFDAIDVLTRNEDILQHLQSVGRNLVDGGLYLIQISHPHDSTSAVYGRFSYSGERDGVHVHIDWAVNQPKFDPVTAVTRVEIEIHVTENGATTTIYDSAEERLTSPQEITLLAQLSGMFKVIAWYGDFNLEQPLDNSPGAKYAIAILQKQVS
jgi:SAM-dependent methyltransferase